MSSISRKICLLGDFAVGKTSTVSRSVRNTFSEKYMTTVGVKVDSKTMQITEDRVLRLVLWDIAGANSLDQLRASYVGGAHGLLLVADGTRSRTLDTALDLHEHTCRRLGRKAPAVLLLNMCDRANEWDITQARHRELAQLLPVFSASAKTGAGVEEAFASLAEAVST